MSEERKSGRPAPLYGEYADDAAQANAEPEAVEPEGTATEGVKKDTGAKDTAGADTITPTPTTQIASSAPASSAPARGADRIPGVPHNLGAAGSSSAGSGVAATGNNAAEPYRAAPPKQGAQRTQNAPPPSASSANFASGTTQPRPRAGDRIITIVLLGLGALGALYSAASLYQLSAGLSTLAVALDIKDFVVPDSVATLGTVGALIVFAIYALNLIYSIQRLRAGKLTFWVPLVAAVIAFIVTFTFTMLAVNAAPEIAQVATDPDALQKMLDYMATQSTP